MDGKAIVDRQLPSVFKSEYWLDKRFQQIIDSTQLRTLLESRMTSIDEFYTITKGLSLNDTFWLKPEGCNISWKDVNPYEKPICTDFANSVLQAMKSGIITNVNRTISSPDFALTGQYDKKWKRIDGDIYLIKAGTPNPYGLSVVGNEPFSEYIAYKIGLLLQLKNRIVKYDLLKQTFQGETRIATKCKLFTTEDVGFIPNEFIAKYGKTDLEFAESHNQIITYLQMCLLDSIIMNIDRHDGNFGYYMKNGEYVIGQMQPIFDNNLSLLCKDAIRNKTVSELTDIITSKKPYKQMCPVGNTFPILGVWQCRELVRRKAISPSHMIEVLMDVWNGHYSVQGMMTGSIVLESKRAKILDWIIRYNAKFIQYALLNKLEYNRITDIYKDNLRVQLEKQGLCDQGG